MLFINQRREIADHQKRLLRLLRLAGEHQHVLVGGNIIDPGKALRIVIQLVQGGMLPAEMVQRLYILPHVSMILVLQQIPLQAFLLVPLVEGGELLSHEQKLLARMHHHEAVGRPQIVQLGIPVARHLAHQRGLPMDHLVMGQA